MHDKLPKLRKNRYNKLTPEEQFDDEIIRGMCEHFRLDCSITEGLVFVRSPYSTWRIFHNYKEIEVVYHENYQKLRRVDYLRRKINEGYHEQDIHATTMYGVLDYIYKHEKGFMKSKNKEQLRLERLFEKVKEERIARERLEQSVII